MFLLRRSCYSSSFFPASVLQCFPFPSCSVPASRLSSSFPLPHSKLYPLASRTSLNFILFSSSSVSAPGPNLRLFLHPLALNFIHCFMLHSCSSIYSSSFLFLHPLSLSFIFLLHVLFLLLFLLLLTHLLLCSPFSSLAFCSCSVPAPRTPFFSLSLIFHSFIPYFFIFLVLYFLCKTLS